MSQLQYKKRKAIDSDDGVAEISVNGSESSENSPYQADDSDSNNIIHHVPHSYHDSTPTKRVAVPQRASVTHQAVRTIVIEELIHLRRLNSR